MSDIRFRERAVPGARYMSGALVFDEQFRNGRLLTRYWSAAGQVWPDGQFVHLPPRGVDEPGDTFALAIDQQDLRGGLTWLGADVTPDPSDWRGDGRPVQHGVVRLHHAERNIDVGVHTRLDGSRFMIRWLEITNRGARPVGITAVAPFAGLLWSHRYNEHLPADVASPFEVGFNHSSEWGREGDFWFEPLPAGVRSVDGARLGRSGHGRPAFWARNRCNGQTLVCELAWGGNYEFALDCRLTADRKKGTLFCRMGLSGHDSVLRVLLPGETLSTPSAHVAFFDEDEDAIIQATHEHVRHVVMPAQIPGHDIEIEANHRGYLWDHETEPALKADAEVAQAIGTELYVIDAGWFGHEVNNWFLNVGDWRAGAWLPNGLEPVADHARKLGMGFGLWVEIEAAGESSTLRKEHPDWLLKRDGVPIANSRALDLAQPQVAAWVQSEIERIIRQYQLAMFRIDHNHLLTPSGNREFHGFTEDLTWRYYEAFDGIFDRVRAKFPQVVFQSCASGGGRLDWGTLHRFHNTELSDWMRMPRGLRIFANVTRSLPPEILLRTFGTETGEMDLEGDLDAQLRLALLGRPIFRGIAPSLPELSEHLRERIAHHLDVYRDWIRPTLRGGRVFHHTPAEPIMAGAPWCVLEYAAPNTSRAVAMIFRLGTAGSAGGPAGAGEEADAGAEYVFKPRGLDVGRTYEVRLDNERQAYRASGAELAARGVPVRLERVLSSQLLIFAAV